MIGIEMNGSIKDFWEKVSFGKIFITLLVLGTVQFVLFREHMTDMHLHKTDKQDRILIGIEENGFPWSDIKEAQFIQVRKDVDKFLLLWQTAEDQGRLELPVDQSAVIRKILEDFIDDREKEKTRKD